MQYTVLPAALFAASIHAQALTSILGTPGVLNLTTILGKYPAIVKTLVGAKDITILAPADGADGLDELLRATTEYGKDWAERFGAPPADAVLTYHVLKGAFPSSALPATAFVETLLSGGNVSTVTGGQRVQVTKNSKGVTITSGLGATSKVTKADIKFDGGYIHLIDSVLTPPKSVGSTLRAADALTLRKVLSKTDLLDTVEGLKDITIFAPVDDAFDAAESVIAGLSEDQLTGALTYHVAKGVGLSTDLRAGQVIPTVNGKSLKVSITNGSVYVNSAKVVKTDLLTKNGVVHLIDAVLLPPA